jgi:hypothetical protein
MNDLVDLTVVVLKQTDAAYLVTDTGDTEDAVWFPKSQVEVEYRQGDLAKVTVPVWLAMEKGLV